MNLLVGFPETASFEGSKKGHGGNPAKKAEHERCRAINFL